MGARVIITSSSDEKLARARALGAWQTVNYRSTPDWEKAVLELTGGRGVDLTVEVGGAGTLEKSIAATRIAATIGSTGVLAGGQVNRRPIMAKSLTVIGGASGRERGWQEGWRWGVGDAEKKTYLT